MQKPRSKKIQSRKRSKVRQSRKTGHTNGLLKFLPAILLFGASFGINQLNAAPLATPSSRSVLGYSTAISASSLLRETNEKRKNNGEALLISNGQLASAAQTKANDMVARDYWSHNTPDGLEPWIFISDAGYQYKTAGENLAYGFSTSADAVTGWMNSPPHRQNILNSTFNEVGFGFAESPNFIGDGPETIIVAMYASPLNDIIAPVTAPTSTLPLVPQLISKGPNSTAQQSAPEALQSPNVLLPSSPNAAPSSTDQSQAKPSDVAIVSTTNVQRIQLLTKGNFRLSGTIVVSLICGVCVLWTIQRGRQIRRLLLTGERYLLKHLHIDLAVMGLVALGYTLLQTSGTIR